MKIVLIRPPEINRIWVGIPQFFNDGIFLFPPLGIMQVKAYIEKHTSHQVTIYDSLMHKADYKKVGEFIRKVSPHVAGISAFTHSLADVVETAREIKKINPLIHITIGGPHTYAFYNESADLLKLGCFDSIVLGDGEEVFRQILQALENNAELDGIEGVIYRGKEGKIVRRGEPAFIKNLEDLPFPSRDIHGFKHYYTPASSGKVMTTMITSRGCPYSCKFCNVQKKYRARSVKNVVDEMESCAKLGVKEIFFIDDTFNVTAERVVQFAEEILRRKLKIKWGFKARCDNISKEMLEAAKKAGCFRVHYGVETGINTGLRSINKNLTLEKIKYAFSETKKAGIKTTGYFIIGCPHEKDREDVLRTINFARALEADFAVFSLLSPYPDAAFYQEGVEKGVFDPLQWASFLSNPGNDYRLPTLWEEHFSKGELLTFLKIAHRKFYYRPKVIFKALMGIHSFTEFTRILTGGVSLLKLELFHNGKGKI